ncbi:hypothetical protein EDC19_2697 [Natranaerovirga hydrolytica]|uniref:Uncharacterized protein n=1 Tax=Natranaerovirga hydrolytica TaxID=680378 RepID=A0A4R1M7U8_9FIRM|nr:hypothetical protein [Natranaerovirga hydrolytica]TCK87857.1 hypothetical protein EDC19_2697 [Natranaerovirga hydrolytica]
MDNINNDFVKEAEKILNGYEKKCLASKRKKMLKQKYIYIKIALGLSIALFLALLIETLA